MSDYNEASFWGKVTSAAKKAGRELIEKAFWIYYTAQEDETPTWAKATIYTALAYLISPVDSIPDITPVIGYSDDLVVLSAALATVYAHVTDRAKARSAAKMEKLFS